MTTLFVPVVLGSVRAARRSERPAILLCERIAHAGHETELLDLQQLDLPMHGRHDGAHPSVVGFRAALDRTDAVVWLTPEYNHGYTAPIKNAIDHTGPELRRKPMAVCGLSGAGIGGARAVEQLKLVLIEMQALPTSESIYFSNAGSLFDEQGRLTRDELLPRIDYMLADLAWYAEALRRARVTIPIPERPSG